MNRYEEWRQTECYALCRRTGLQFNTKISWKLRNAFITGQYDGTLDGLWRIACQIEPNDGFGKGSCILLARVLYKDCHGIK